MRGTRTFETEHDPGPDRTAAVGVYTHVRWKGLRNSRPSQEFQIQYVAAIPIRRTTTGWTGTEPTAKASGRRRTSTTTPGPKPSTRNRLTTRRVDGKYKGVAGQRRRSIARTAEDLAMQKSVDRTTIDEGRLAAGPSTWRPPIPLRQRRPDRRHCSQRPLPGRQRKLRKTEREAVEQKAECDPAPGSKPTDE